MPTPEMRGCSPCFIGDSGVFLCQALCPGTLERGMRSCSRYFFDVVIFFNSLSLVRPMKSSRFGLGLRSTVMNVQSFKTSLPVMGEHIHRRSIEIKIQFNSIRSSCEELNASRGSLAQPFPYIRSKFPQDCKHSTKHVWCSSHAFARRILKNSPRIYFKETAELTALRGSSEVVTRTLWYTSVYMYIAEELRIVFQGFLKLMFKIGRFEFDIH